MANWGYLTWTGNTTLLLAGSQYAAGGEFTVPNQKIDSVSLYLAANGGNNVGLKLRVGVYSGGDPVTGTFSAGGRPVLVEDLGEQTIAVDSGLVTWTALGSTIPVDGTWIMFTLDNGNLFSLNTDRRISAYPAEDIDSFKKINVGSLSSTPYTDPAPNDLIDNNAQMPGIYLTHSDAAGFTTQVGAIDLDFTVTGNQGKV